MAGKKSFQPEQALDKAMGLFWKQGYEGTSIEDLVQYMGLGRGSLGEVQLCGADSRVVRCFLFPLDDTSMEIAAIPRDLCSQFGAAFRAVDPQSLGKQPGPWLQHGKTLASERRSARHDLQRPALCEG